MLHKCTIHCTFFKCTSKDFELAQFAILCWELRPLTTSLPVGKRTQDTPLSGNRLLFSRKREDFAFLFIEQKKGTSLLGGDYRKQITRRSLQSSDLFKCVHFPQQFAKGVAKKSTLVQFFGMSRQDLIYFGMKHQCSSELKIAFSKRNGIFFVIN